MFCPNCGKKMNDDAKFCSECGNTIVDDYNHRKDTEHVSDKSIIELIGKTR